MVDGSDAVAIWAVADDTDDDDNVGSGDGIDDGGAATALASIWVMIRRHEVLREPPQYFQLNFMCDRNVF